MVYLGVEMVYVLLVSPGRKQVGKFDRLVTGPDELHLGPLTGLRILCPRELLRRLHR